jgi:hypothetical protein
MCGSREVDRFLLGRTNILILLTCFAMAHFILNGNPGYGFGQEHKCGGDKLVNDITKTV